jgi:hypothetical protein
MKVYRRLWVGVSGPLTIVGLIVGFALAPIPVTILFVVFGAFSADVTLCLLQNDDADRPPRARSHVLARNATVVGAAVGAFVGYSILLGPGGLLLLILVLASSPCAVNAYGRWLHSVPAPSSAQLDIMVRALSYASPEYLTFQPSLGVAAFTDEELCQSWQSSYTALQHQSTAPQMATTVAERQVYLDELERRHPRGFASWLASGARAPGNPLPYLTRGRADQPAIDWDTLTRGQDW